MLLLFYLRLLIYLVAVFVPVFHPAVVVSYDSTIRWLWFLLVPAQMHLAFYLAPPRFKARLGIGASVGVIVVSLAVLTGINGPVFLFVGIQAAAFATTALVFRSRGVARPFVFLETVLLIWLFVKLLGFSRASETFAEASSLVTQGLLAVSIGALLLHSFVLYMAVYGEGLGKRSGRELALFATVAVIIGIAVALFMPPDFVNHSVALNDLKNPPNPDPIPLDERGDGLEGGNLQSDRRADPRDDSAGNTSGEQEGENDSGGDEEGQEPRLEGIPAEQWDSRPGQGDSQSGEGQEGENQGEGDQQGEGQGESKQYAVMVVASKQDPVYAADAYFGAYDPYRGFMLSRDNPLNELTYLRLLETWNNPNPTDDSARALDETFIISSESARYIPYEPRAVRPTILNRVYHPFDFSYAAISAFTEAGETEWRRVIGLNDEDRQGLSEYLQIDLRDDVEDEVVAYYNSIVDENAGYFERLDSILKGFSSFQYNIGFTDDVSVDHIVDFLKDTRDGDCTEFSNSTAILARMAGIPTRVVTGYLASSGLQTPTHTRGLMALQQVIEPLQEYPLDDLFLVTTAHRHSWVQVYMPGYGWVDVETTATAMPPMGGFNPNEMDVVIPIIEPEDVVLRNFEFPWLLTLQTLLGLAVAAFVGTYLFRYGRLLFLKRLSRGDSAKSLKALYSLLLMRLASEGYPIKPVAETSFEYAESHPELTDFAELYTTLRYRERFGDGERRKQFDRLRGEYTSILSRSKRQGLQGVISRIFSLRDLRY